MLNASRRSHLWPALLAVVSVALAVAGLEISIRRRLPDEMDRFAATMAPVKLTGNVLQTVAFQTPGLLLVYGSSELDKPAEYRPAAFFEHRPTGFGVFPIGKAGNTCLILLEKLAAAGEAVRGKKVAIFLSPSWFLRDASADALEANLRPLQVGSWIFGGKLGPGLRRDIARRLAAFSGLFARQPLLATALRDLVDGSWLSRVQLALLTPLGRAQNFLLQRAEYWAILREFSDVAPTHRQRVHLQRHTVLEAPRTLPNWAALMAAGEAHDCALGNSSPFSIGAPARDEQRTRSKALGLESADADTTVAGETDAQSAGEKDEDFYEKLAASSEWTDLTLLLRTLQNLKADAFIICQPFNGKYRDSGGNTPHARQAFYNRLTRTVQAAGYPVRTFSEHEEDRTFFSDSGHPSAKAWVCYDEALDAFYHGGGTGFFRPAP